MHRQYVLGNCDVNQLKWGRDNGRKLDIDLALSCCTIMLYRKGKPNMTVEISYSQARQRLASLLDAVTDDREIVIIRRRKGEPAALIAADELASLTETAHLLRSPANASRLLEALARALKGGGRTMTLEELRSDVGLAE